VLLDDDNGLGPWLRARGEVCRQRTSAGLLQCECHQRGPCGHLQFRVRLLIPGEPQEEFIGQAAEGLFDGDPGVADQPACELDRQVPVSREAQPVGVDVLVGVVAAIGVELRCETPYE
jgi:hypothetical protein